MPHIKGMIEFDCDFDALAEEMGKSGYVKVVRCKECVYGEQDDIGRWFCRSLGCQVGDEDGSGFCADGERRETNETD